MAKRIPCEFFLIRYVPDVVKGEFINIGVMLREAAPEPGKAITVRFTRDWSRVRCIHPDADIGLLESLEAEFAARLNSEAMALQLATPAARSLLSVLADSLSNSIQITEPRASLAETLGLELDLLLRLYVDPLRSNISRQRTGRAAIVEAMRTEFERTGAWSLMRKRIPASRYTRAGDPMKIDCGYRPNGVIRMFHAVSLEGDIEAARGLAYTAPLLREGVLKIDDAELDLTAVVEPLRSVSGEDFDEEAAGRYRFGVEAMEEQQIRVITVSDLTRAAETARIELRL